MINNLLFVSIMPQKQAIRTPERREVVASDDSGQSPNTIALAVNRRRVGIVNLLNRVKGRAGRRLVETRGRPAVLSDREKRRIGRHLASNLEATANEVIANLNLPVSKSTIVRFLSEDYEYIPMKPVSHLSDHHIQQSRDIIRGWVAAAVDWSKSYHQ